jgi:5'-nucleotidase
MRISRRRAFAISGLTAALLTAAAAPGLAGAPPSKPRPGDVEIQLLAFNDYHGHLEPPSGSSGAIAGTPAGGSAYLAAHLAELRQGQRNSLTVAAGDLIGGSPFLSGLFHDEPSVETLNQMGLDVSSVGNHEFDEGVTELLRMQNGGCHPEDGCYFPDEPYAGADFQWLAANVVNEQTGKTALPPFWVEKFQGAEIGFIGMTLEGTPALVAQSGIDGWSFEDEVETANALVPILKRQGIEAIVVLLHEGGLNAGAYNGCTGVSSPIAEIAASLDAEIDAVVTGHTHQPYVCTFTDPAGAPRLVTSASSFGRIITEVNVTIDRTTKDIRRDTMSATNHIVTRDLDPDPSVSSIVAKWKALSDTFANDPVGAITADITRAFTNGEEDRGKESSVGNLVADAQLARTQGNGAQLALMNPGGLRSDLFYAPSVGEGDGVVTYGEAFNVQPFGNLLSTIPMTGAQITSVLQQQCQPVGSSRPFLHLGVSEGVTYDLQKTIGTVNGKLACTAVSVSDLRLDGVAIDPAGTYSVTVNNFLADGGDNFTTFRQIPASERIGGGEDLDALIDYLGDQSPVAPPGTDRVNELP